MPNEICILCGKETNVDMNTHIDHRYGYVAVPESSGAFGVRNTTPANCCEST